MSEFSWKDRCLDAAERLAKAEARAAKAEGRWSALMDWLITEHRAEQEKARMMIDVTAFAEEREVAYGRAIRYMDRLSSTEAVRVVIQNFGHGTFARVIDGTELPNGSTAYLVGVRDGE